MPYIAQNDATDADQLARKAQVDAGDAAVQSFAIQRGNHTGTQPLSTISDVTTAGGNIAKMANPGAITFLRINADNTVTALSAAGLISALGLGTAATHASTDFDAAGAAAAAQTAVIALIPAYAVGSGSANAYTATLSPVPGAYVTGRAYRFQANAANTGAATINFNGLGAKTIKKAPGGITTDLAANDIRANQWVDVVYDGTNMQMQSTLGNAAPAVPIVTSIASPGSDANVPSEKAVRANLDLKANLASPPFTGTPTTPTPPTSDNSTTAANTTFVKNAIAAATQPTGTISTVGTTLSTGGGWGATLANPRSDITLPLPLTTQGQTFQFSNTPGSLNIPWPAGTVPTMAVDLSALAPGEVGSISVTGVQPGGQGSQTVTPGFGDDQYDIVGATASIDCGGQISAISAGAPFTASQSIFIDGVTYSASLTFYSTLAGGSGVVDIDGRGWADEDLAGYIAGNLTAAGWTATNSFLVDTYGPIVYFTSSGGGPSDQGVNFGNNPTGALSATFDLAETITNFVSSFNSLSNIGTASQSGNTVTFTGNAYGPDASFTYVSGPGTPLLTSGSCDDTNDTTLAETMAAAMNDYFGGNYYSSGTTVVCAVAPFTSTDTANWTVGSLGGISNLYTALGIGTISNLTVQTLSAETITITGGTTFPFSKTIAIPGAGIYDITALLNILATGGDATALSDVMDADSGTLVVSASGVTNPVFVLLNYINQ